MFNKFDITRKEFYFGIYLLCTPFLYYSYELFPNSKIMTIYGIVFKCTYFTEWSDVVWIFMMKFIPLSVLLGMFFLSRRRIILFLLPLIGMYIFQLYSLLNDELRFYDTVNDFWLIIPIQIVMSVILIKAKQLLNKNRLKRQKEELLLKEKMINLKHQALNAQMNPHFINNLLLHIYVALEKGDQKNSLSNLGNFSQLVSLVLKSTKSDFISLEDELKIADYYFKLQQSRFEYKFQYSIQNSNVDVHDLDLIKVPPMILQPIIENSIEHGIRSKDSDGVIEINLSDEEEYLYCEIADNGIGYSKSKEIQKKYSSGISLKNIEERLEIMGNGISNKKFVKIEDRLNDNNEIIGTKVILKIPMLC